MPIALMLATLTDRRDFGEEWLLEELTRAWRLSAL
jgi:hypothetical protein